MFNNELRRVRRFLVVTDVVLDYEEVVNSRTILEKKSL